MTRVEHIADIKRQMANTPPHKRKALLLLYARLKSLMTRQLAYENKIDRKIKRAA